MFLSQAGEKKLGTDESVFNLVLCTRSYPQLRATFEKYRTITGKGILDSISREMSGALKDGFSAIGNHFLLLFFYSQQYFLKSF